MAHLVTIFFMDEAPNRHAVADHVPDNRFVGDQPIVLCRKATQEQSQPEGQHQAGRLQVTDWYGSSLKTFRTASSDCDPKGIPILRTGICVVARTNLIGAVQKAAVLVERDVGVRFGECFVAMTNLDPHLVHIGGRSAPARPPRTPVLDCTSASSSNDPPLPSSGANLDTQQRTGSEGIQ